MIGIVIGVGDVAEGIRVRIRVEVEGLDRRECEESVGFEGQRCGTYSCGYRTDYHLP